MREKEDLVQSICKGEGKQFRGIMCGYYEPDAQECELLRDEPLQAVFEKGRCQPLQHIVRPLVKKHLERYDYQKDCQDFKKSVKALAEGFAEQYIRKQKLHGGCLLPVLRGFINRIVSRKILDYVQQEGILPKMLCGECVHLSQEKPHICERMTIISKGEEMPNEHYRTKRTPGEKACKDGFEGYKFMSEEAIGEFAHPPDSDFDEFRSGVAFEHIAFLLAEQAENAADAEKRKIGNRQHYVFVRVAQLIKGMEKAGAIAIVADECGVNLRTIKRDLDQIERFLHTKCPEWFKITDFNT